MSEPDYLAHTDGCETPQQRQDWIAAKVAEARAQGVTFSRATINEDGTLLLYEGWHIRPVDSGGNLDQGEPRWPSNCTRNALPLTDPGGI